LCDPVPDALLRPAGPKEPAMTRKLILALCAGALAFTASACNTVRGAGEDLESAADTVDKKI
jgi:entericidin B